jgi:hypothetical protein
MSFIDGYASAADLICWTSETSFLISAEHSLSMSRTNPSRYPGHVSGTLQVPERRSGTSARSDSSWKNPLDEETRRDSGWQDCSVESEEIWVNRLEQDEEVKFTPRAVLQERKRKEN